jgi:hypothetical protein
LRVVVHFVANPFDGFCNWLFRHTRYFSCGLWYTNAINLIDGLAAWRGRVSPGGRYYGNCRHYQRAAPLAVAASYWQHPF